MRIAVIGAGRVGSAIGEGWKKAGHIIRYGTRSLVPDQVSVSESSAWAEVIAIATPWSAVEQVCASLGKTAGKIILDCTNPVVMSQGPPARALGPHESGADYVARWCPGAHVFKTLNQTGFENIINVGLFPQKPAMLVAGDDPMRKESVLSLVADLGFEAVDAGPLSNARLVESLALLWIDLAFKRGRGRGFALTFTNRLNR
jgi:8-hydroxy-5-deazaflavin:NADPH oxidoreductase